MNEEPKEPTPERPIQEVPPTQPALAEPPAEALPLFHHPTTVGEGRAGTVLAEPPAVVVPPSMPPISQVAATSPIREEFLWKVHSYINEYVRFADTKAGFCVALAAAVMGALYSAKAHTQFMGTPPLQWPLLAWLSIAAFAALFASIVFAVSAVRPRLWIHSSKGLIFWDSISKHGSPEAFSSAVLNEPASELDSHVAHHLYSLSAVCRRKYKYVNAAILAGVLGGGLGAIVLLFRQ